MLHVTLLIFYVCMLYIALHFVLLCNVHVMCMDFLLLLVLSSSSRDIPEPALLLYTLSA